MARRTHRGAAPRARRPVRGRRSAPRYIVLEGIDGAGKTELARAVARALALWGHRVLQVREPSDPFLRAEAERLAGNDPLSAAWCFTLDRALQRPQIDRAISEGRRVVQDRSFYSTLAYQGSRLPPAGLRELERLQRAIARPPDLVLWLDAPVEVARARFLRRGRTDRFERLVDLERVRSAFARLYEPSRWVRLEASRGAREVRAQALLALRERGL